MSNTTDTSIFGKMTSRAAGKRQIKPTAVLYATLNENHSSDEEDEDFEVKMKEEDGHTNSGSDDGSSDGSESGSDEEESEENEDEEEDGEKGKASSPDREIPVEVCGVCINRRDPAVAGDFMKCDKCQLYVHESCYGSLAQEDLEETRWFCDPCLYGLVDPPHCEMCPSRVGAFKKAELPDRWCHVACSIFTHGVTFSEPDTLTGPSWEHLDNSLFGKRTCTVCTDKIEARFGISNRCESGMCKEYMHVTCAQKLGLLVDETDEHEEMDAIAVMRYFYCKKHTNVDNLKPIQRRYADWERQETKRISVHRRRNPLNTSEEELRLEMWEKMNKLIQKELDANPKGIVGDRQKQARLLNTSSEFFDRFETKFEDAGMSKETFREPFFNIKLTSTSYIPIGFSKEYIDFMQLRDTQIIPEEEEKLRKLRNQVSETKEKHTKQLASKQFTERLHENEKIIEEKLSKLDELHALIQQFSANEKHEDFSGILSVFRNGSARQSAERARGTPDMREIHCCVVCEMATEQHKQTQCDECHKSYHIGCLTPPLTRLPKRNNCGWICHVCNESDESEPEVSYTSDENSTATRATRSRRPPARLSGYVNH